ncbi:hypothetical protein LCGC14_1590200, partial [marine sediment metagenome]
SESIEFSDIYLNDCSDPMPAIK